MIPETINFLKNVVIGFFLGIVAGIVPGLHPNLIALVSLTAFRSPSSFVVLSVMLVTSQFFSFVRSVFLFVPDESHVLAIHPIYKFVREGKGLVALKLGITGIMIALIVSIIASPILIWIIPLLFEYVSPFIPLILLVLSGFFVLRDKRPVFALAIFLSAGLLGWFGLDSMEQPLLALFSGFFALPILLKINPHVPKQLKPGKINLKRKTIFKGSIVSMLSATIAIFLPGVGPAQASLLTRSAMKKTEEFVLSIGSLSGFNITFSAILLYTLKKSRVGALVMLGEQYLFDLNYLIVFLFLCLGFGLLAYLATLYLGRFVSNKISKINYRVVSVIVVLFVSGLVFWFDGLIGLAFLFGASLIGWWANKLGVRMANCMGSLVLPILIFYFV